MTKSVAVIIVCFILGAAIVYDMMRTPQSAPVVPVASDEVKDVPLSLVPDLTLNAMDGSTFKLRDIKEPVVLLHFWASWCAPCVVEFPQLTQLLRDMDGKVAMVAVSLDYKRPPLDRFIEKQDTDGLPIYWVHDTDFRIAYKEFMISQLPETIIVDPADVMRDKIIGEYDWSSEEIRTQLTSYLNGSI